MTTIGETWTCHVCGTERPDMFISVFTRQRMIAGRFPVRENVRFCNDRSACVTAARDVSFLKHGEEA